MDEERKKAYQDKFQARIREWEAKLEQLGARARRAEADLRLQLQDEESELRQRLDEAKARLSELKDASGDGWDEIRSGAERLWSDVRAAWERTGPAGGPAGGSPSADAAGSEENEAGPDGHP